MAKAVENLKKNGKGFFADFKAFIMKGNVLDLAVAVVIGAAFNAITTGLVKNIITPLLTYFTSGVSIDEWKYVLKEAVIDEAGVITAEEVAIMYGLWIQTIIDFLIIAFTIFVVLRIFKNAERRLNAKKIAAAEAEAEAKKAEEEAEKAAAEAAAAEEKAVIAEYYENIRKQSKLLAEINEKLNK